MRSNRLHKLHNRRDKSGKEHDDQENNARDDKAALGHTIFIFAPDNQTDIAQGVLGSGVVPTSSMKMSVKDGSTTSKRLMMPPCCSAASTIRLGLRLA